MTLLGFGRFFARPPRISPEPNAPPVADPAFLVFQIVANAAPQLSTIKLSFGIVTDAPSEGSA